MGQLVNEGRLRSPGTDASSLQATCTVGFMRSVLAKSVVVAVVFLAACSGTTDVEDAFGIEEPEVVQQAPDGEAAPDSEESGGVQESPDSEEDVPETVVAANPSDVEETVWILHPRTVGVDGISDDSPVSLTFDGSTLSGASGCNSYRSEYRLDEGQFGIDDLESTQAFCSRDERGLENSYLWALTGANSIQLAGDDLVLSGDFGELIFQPETIAQRYIADLHGTSWAFVSGLLRGSSVEVDEDYNAPWLRFNGAGIGGNDVCNTWGADYQIDDGRFVIGRAVSTLVGCSSEQDQAWSDYRAAWRRVDAIERSGDELTLSGPEVELIFERSNTERPPELVFLPKVLPLDEMTSMRWVLEDRIQGGKSREVFGELPLVVELDGTFSATTGCNELEGTYVASGFDIEVTSFDSTNRDCLELGEHFSQDNSITRVLNAEFYPVFDGCTMTLTATISNERLIYRAVAEQ